MTFGVLPTGFERKRLPDILDDLNSQLSQVFGNNINVSPESPEGQINGLLAESYANLWELIEFSYNAFDPSAATGETLSSLVTLNGITRLSATSTRVELTLTGTPGTLVPQGSIVSASSTGVQMSTLSDAIIAPGVTVFADVSETGPIIILAASVDSIDMPINGWDAVTNISAGVTGRNVETDIELRIRRAQSVARGAQNILDSIFAEIASVDGVTNVLVLENDTDITSSEGLPPHSFNAVVTGGADQDIGDAIWLNKPVGILSFGATATTILDSQGVSHTISFDRPTIIPVFVRVITEIDMLAYPADGDDQIRQLIIDYANGLVLPDQRFGLGDDVIVSRLFTPANRVNGHNVQSILIGGSVATLLDSDFVIPTRSISQFVLANIDIVQV